MRLNAWLKGASHRAPTHFGESDRNFHAGRKLQPVSDLRLPAKPRGHQIFRAAGDDQFLRGGTERRKSE